MGAPERSFAGVVAVAGTVAAVFWPTSASMVSVWSSSGTYSHGFFIVPAFLWLVWQRRHMLASVPARPSWRSLPLLATLGLIWLAGQWMALALPSQLALVAMVPAAIAGLFGVAWVRALLFPLAFLFFAVPFGESLMPVLMNWTADFTVAALRLSGVPVYRDGLHFDIPSGKWSVVDSCSGIRYLFAGLAVSSLYGWTIYRSNLRRGLFVAAALVIVIVANWIRAYAIVLLGHLSNNQIATGADHLVYGGLFFGVIMTLVFALGRFWREGPTPSPRTRSGALMQAQRPPVRSNAMPPPVTVAATLAVLLLWPAVSIRSSWQTEQLSLAAPNLQPEAGWVGLERPLSSWRPVLINPASTTSQSFAKGESEVGIHIGLFGRSTPSAQLTSTMNRLVEPDGLNPHWKLAHQGQAQARWAGTPIEVRTGILVGSETRLLAWQWYWIDGVATSDPLRASMLQLLARLRGHGDMSAWVSVYTQHTGDLAGSAHALSAFLTDMSDSISAALSERPVANAGGASSD